MARAEALERITHVIYSWQFVSIPGASAAAAAAVTAVTATFGAISLFSRESSIASSVVYGPTTCWPGAWS
uniref:Uncharacterized protein n=1 Tax=Trichogramma kaykai TaxID=54128 RepID=A0ABD2XHS1_9HYME